MTQKHIRAPYPGTKYNTLIFFFIDPITQTTNITCPPNCPDNSEKATQNGTDDDDDDDNFPLVSAASDFITTQDVTVVWNINWNITYTIATHDDLVEKFMPRPPGVSAEFDMEAPYPEDEGV